MNVYADSSFVVSLYLRERQSNDAIQRMADRPRLWLTPLHVAEWTLAVEQRVFRKDMSRREAERVYEAFERGRTAAIWTEVALPESALSRCVELAHRHVSHLGNRTLDTLHVACALELNAEQFWTFDDRQARLARAAGLKTE